MENFRMLMFYKIYLWHAEHSVSSKRDCQEKPNKVHKMILLLTTLIFFCLSSGIYFTLILNVLKGNEMIFELNSFHCRKLKLLFNIDLTLVKLLLALFLIVFLLWSVQPTDHLTAS